MSNSTQSSAASVTTPEASVHAFASWMAGLENRMDDDALDLDELVATAQPWAESSAKLQKVDTAALWKAGVLQLEGVRSYRRGCGSTARGASEQALSEYTRALALASVPGLSKAARAGCVGCQILLGRVEFAGEAWGDSLRWFCRARNVCLAHRDDERLGSILLHIAEVYGVAGLWALELELALEARGLAERVGNQASVGAVDLHLAQAYRKLRDFPEARARSKSATEIFRAIRSDGEELRVELELARIDLAEGRPADARERLRKCAVLSAEVADPALEAARLGDLGRACLSLKRGREAIEFLQTAIELLRQHGGAEQSNEFLCLRLQFARAYLACSAWADARSEALAILEVLKSLSTPTPMETDVHAVLAEAARGVCEWQVACDHEVAKSMAFERHYNRQAALRISVLTVRHEIDMARASAKRELEERAKLQQKLAEMQARLRHCSGGDRVIDEVTATELESLGLSAREADVLLWVARGKTNDEIAAILGRSISTVKKHLEGSFRKLGVENRLAAATVVFQFAGRVAGEGAAVPTPRIAS